MSSLRLIPLVRRGGGAVRFVADRQHDEAEAEAAPTTARRRDGVAVLGLAMPLAVLLIGVAMAGGVAQHVVTAQRRLAAAPQGGR